MGMGFKSKSTAAAILALSGFGADQVLADGKFIVQPSRSKPAAAEVTDGSQFERANDQASIANRQQPELESLPPVPPKEASVFIPQSMDATWSGGLKWIDRGSHSALLVGRQPGGPIELDNLNYSPSAGTMAVSQVPGANQPTTSVPRPMDPASSASTGAASRFRLANEHAPADEGHQSSRAVLAALVSNQITSGRSGHADPARCVEPIDNPPGWQAIGEELSARLQNCEMLINRKAYFSAREDAEAAMLYLVRVLDLMSNNYRSEPAWCAASKAMSEAEDFSTTQRLTSDSDFLRRIILSHETPVLKDADAATLAPLAAAQHYRQYAEEKLIEAAQGHPWASEVAYALGRSYQAQADLAEVDSQHSLRWRAIVLYRAARSIAPNNTLAHNQLGYVLLQMDRPADAREALMASIHTSPSLTAFENLVEASRRIGDTGTANWAMQRALAFQNSYVPAAGAPPYVELDPRTFAALSPYSAGPRPSPPSQNAPAQPFRTAAASPPTQNQ